jgi:protein involved in polysaccharide export with SLBB domain
MRVEPFACIVLAVALTASGCMPSGEEASETPSGRERFVIPAVRPQMRAYRGTTVDYDGRQPVPRLPAAPGTGRTAPVDPAVDAPVPTYAERDVLPVRQHVYGGDEGPVERPGPYRLVRGDTVALRVEAHPEFSGSLAVRTDGSVELPLCKRRVPAAGRSLDELRPAIAEVLADYIRDTSGVSLGLDFTGGRTYRVFGAVGRAGRYPMGTEPIRASEAIFRACSANAAPIGADAHARMRAETDTQMRDSFTPPAGADLKRVYLITPHPSRPRRQVIDVEAALFGGRTGGDPLLKGGQILYVPAAGMAADDARLRKRLDALMRPRAPDPAAETGPDRRN